MRIASGVTDQYIYFVAVDSTDFTTREQTLSSFTVRRSRNGGASAAMTLPTINETDTTNMPGVYELLLDEDMTIDAGDDTQEMVFHITHAGMAPVTRTIELYRPKITAGNTLDVTATGAGGIDWGNVENPTTAVDLSATDIQLCDTITTYTGNTVQTGDSFARIGVAGAGLTNIDLPNQTMDITGNLSGSVGSVTGAVGSVTGAVGSVTGSVGSVTGAVGSVTAAVTIDAGSVDAILDETLTSHVTADSVGVALKDTLADTNELQSDDVPGLIAALNDVSAADVNAQCDTAISDAALATAAALATVDTEVGDILVDTGTTIPAQLDSMSGTTFSSATDSLEAIRDRGDAAWTTGAGGTPPQLLQSTTIATLASQTSFTLTAGSADDDAYNGAVAVITDQSTATQKAVGSVLDYTGATKTVTLTSDPGIFTMATGDTIDIIANASTAPTAAAVRAEIDTNSTQLALIVGDTNELQGDWANGGRLDVILDARASQSSVDTIDGIVDNILIDTAEIGAAGAGLTALATQASVNTIDGIVDAILVDTGTTLPASIATVDGNVDAILVDTGTTMPASLATIDGNVDAILVDTAEIGAAGAGLTVLATAANLATVDTVVDAIKAQTDSLNFTVAGVVDANTLRINGAVVVGDGNVTPWDGA